MRRAEGSRREDANREHPVRPAGRSTPSTLVGVPREADGGTRERGLLWLQRSAGNAAVQSTQSAKVREVDRLKAQARRTLAMADWRQVAQRMKELPDPELDNYSKAMTRGERAHARWATLHSAPELDRVGQSIAKVDSEAVRISDIYFRYESGMARQPAPNWQQAADALRVMSADDIQRRIDVLTWAQKMELRAAAKDDVRLADLIEKSEQKRIASVYAAYQRAVGDQQWETAAHLLNGMSASDIETRIRALTAEEYEALKRASAVAGPAVQAAFTRVKPPGELQGVEYPVPEPKPESELSDVLEQGQQFGGDPDVAAYARLVAEAEAANAPSKPAASERSVVVSPEGKLAELNDHFWATVGHPRFAEVSPRRRKHGWMVGVRERLRGRGIQGPTEFAPRYPAREKGESDKAYQARKAAHVDALEPKKIPIPGGGTGKVLPYVAAFIVTLQGKWSAFACQTRKDTGTHGLGYGIDCTLTGSHAKLDSRGLYQPSSALAFLKAVEEAAGQQSPPLRWTALYNDAQVQHSFPEGRVGYQGSEGNWHGPLVLHFHIEVTPTAPVE